MCFSAITKICWLLSPKLHTFLRTLNEKWRMWAVAKYFTKSLVNSVTHHAPCSVVKWFVFRTDACTYVCTDVWTPCVKVMTPYRLGPGGSKSDFSLSVICSILGRSCNENEHPLILVFSPYRSCVVIILYWATKGGTFQGLKYFGWKTPIVEAVKKIHPSKGRKIQHVSGTS